VVPLSAALIIAFILVHWADALATAAWRPRTGRPLHDADEPAG
jgi:hypothetical protein